MKRSIPLLALMFGAVAFAQTQTATFSYSGSPLGIPTSNLNTPVVAEIYVPTELTISSVTAQVQITYPKVSDLQVFLYSANGTRTILLNNDCGSIANVNTTFDDSAATKYSSFCPQEAGRGPFRGNEPLANSKGQLSAGYWDLVVQNTKSNSNSGLVQSFSLTITGTPVTTPAFTADAVVNSASLAGGVIAPGELVTIFGVALGPQQGVTPTSGGSGSSVGGTTVTFDGQPAAILYSSYYQVNVQAPYTLVPGKKTNIQVQSTGGTGANVPVDVISSVAGLFTVQSNGTGQVLAVNQDGSQNSNINGAAAGSYVSLYATGLGAVTPAVNAGAVPPNSPLSTVNGGVTVVIGGLVAPVTYAGLAPGYPGLYQINVQIPAGVGSGANRIFIVAPNGYSSQGRTFIQVQ